MTDTAALARSAVAIATEKATEARRAYSDTPVVARVASGRVVSWAHASLIHGLWSDSRLWSNDTVGDDGWCETMYD